MLRHEGFYINDIEYKDQAPRTVEIADPVKLTLFYHWITDGRSLDAKTRRGLYKFYLSDDEAFYVEHIPESYFMPGATFEEWFAVNYNRAFVISSPIWSGETVTCTFPNRQISLSESTSQAMDIAIMRINNAYTICDGLTIAIALHRRRILSSRRMRAMLTRKISYSEYYESLQPYYNGHTLPMVADVPYHYALRDSDMSVIDHIQSLVDPHIPTTGVYRMIEQFAHTVYMTPLSVLFHGGMTAEKWRRFIPYWPTYINDVDNDVEGMIDCLCRGSKRLWRWWLRPNHGPQILLQLMSSRDQVPPPVKIRGIIARRYNEDPTHNHRLVVIWRQLLALPWMTKEVFWNEETVDYLPMPLLMDVLRRWEGGIEYYFNVVLKRSNVLIRNTDLICKWIIGRKRQRTLVALKRHLPYEVAELMIDYYKRHRSAF